FYLYPRLIHSRNYSPLLAGGLEPGSVAGQQHRRAAYLVELRLVRRRRRDALVAQRLGSLEQPLPHADDAQVAGAEMLLAAVVDWAHALLHGGVLSPEFRKARVELRPLQLAAPEIIILATSLRPERQ